MPRQDLCPFKTRALSFAAMARAHRVRGAGSLVARARPCNPLPADRQPRDAVGVDPAHRERFRALADLTERLRRGDPGTLASLQGALAAGPLHQTAVAELARSFGRGWSARRLAAMQRLWPRAAEPIGTVAVVAPGNLFVAGWQAVLEPWLAGNRMRVRPSSDDGGALPWLLDQIGHAAAAIDLYTWPRGDAQAGVRFLARVDALAVWGGDLALAELQHLVTAAGFSGPVRLHGPRSGLAIVDVRAGNPSASALAGLARDVVLGDGRGCMGVGRVWWHGANANAVPALHDLLAATIARAARRWPPGSAHAATTPAAAMRAEAVAVAAAVTPGARFSPRPDGWLLSTAELPGMDAVGTAPGRCVVAAPIEPRLLPAALAQRVATVSVVATDLPAAVARALALDLGCRWCRPGRAQIPRADQGHDGYRVFEGFWRPISARRAGA